MIYGLYYYWPGIQGRRELVRLALEDTAAKYAEDVTAAAGPKQIRDTISSCADPMSWM